MALRIEEFTGFPPEAFTFYADLAREGNNDRAWFDEHRGVYERAVRLPMEELLDRAATDGFGDDGKVFRPNRDVRFSKDKRPYKEHCGAVITSRTGTARAGVYVQVAADGMHASTGYWELSRDQLERYRRAVDDARSGGRLVRLVEAARAAGCAVTGSALKRAPRGVDPGHPRIELLRHKKLVVSRTWPVSPWMHTAAAYDHVARTWRDGEPIVRWLDQHVGAATEPRRRRGG
ncbi:MAG: DUF2461 domain-containing protein [Nitriliruptor sp.]